MSWPPKQPSLGAAFAATLTPPALPHAGTWDWWRDHDQRAAHQKKEFESVDAYYGKLHVEAEEKHNAEVRERIVAAQTQQLQRRS